MKQTKLNRKPFLEVQIETFDGKDFWVDLISPEIGGIWADFIIKEIDTDFRISSTWFKEELENRPSIENMESLLDLAIILENMRTQEQAVYLQYLFNERQDFGLTSIADIVNMYKLTQHDELIVIFEDELNELIEVIFRDTDILFRDDISLIPYIYIDEMAKWIFRHLGKKQSADLISGSEDNEDLVRNYLNIHGLHDFQDFIIANKTKFSYYLDTKEVYAQYLRNDKDRQYVLVDGNYVVKGDSYIDTHSIYPD